MKYYKTCVQIANYNNLLIWFQAQLFIPIKGKENSKMLNKKNQPLKLNSYKIDTQSLQNSLRQLNEMKEEMQSTLSNYKSNQSQLVTENQRLKQQIQILQNKAEAKVDLSSYHSKILKLETELKQQKKQTEKFKKLHEAEKKSKENMMKQYESKLEDQKQGSKINTDKYQQRIAALSNELKQAKYTIEISKIEKTSKNSSVENNQKINKTADPKKRASDSQNQYRSNAEESQFQRQPNKNNPGSNMPPKSPSSNTLNRDPKSNRDIYEKNKQVSQNYVASYIPNEEDEQIFLTAIRKLYSEIKQLGLSPSQMIVLPQFKKMAANKQPTRRDIMNFLKSPPIEQKNEQNLQRDVNLLEDQIRKKYGKISGNYLIQTIVARVEEYESASKQNTDEFSISNTYLTPSLSKENSTYEKFSNKSEHNYQKPGQYINASRPSINDNLRMESQTSMF